MADNNIKINNNQLNQILHLLKNADLVTGRTYSDPDEVLLFGDDSFLNRDDEKNYFKENISTLNLDDGLKNSLLEKVDSIKEDVNEGNFKEIFGLEVSTENDSTVNDSNSAEETSPTTSEMAADTQKPVVRPHEKPTLGDKKSEKLAQNKVLKEFTLDSTAFTEAMNEIYKNDNFKNEAGYYSYLHSVAQSVIESVNAQQMNNKKDIEKAYKTVKKDLKEPLKDFKLDVLKKVIELREGLQKEDEYSEMRKMYDAKTISGTTRKKAVKQVKKEKNGSYYDELGSRLKKDAKADAEQAYADAQENLTGQGVENYRKVTNTAYDKMEDKSYVKKHNLSTYGIIRGEESSNKLRSKAVAAENRVNARRTKLYTDKEFLDVLKNDDILTGLKKAKLITIDENDSTKIDENDSTKFKLTALSDLIGKYVGADFIASTQRDGKDLMSEVENVRSELETVTGHEVSTKDAINLIKMCGYDVYTKNYKKALSDAFLGSVPGLVGSAAGITAMMSLLNTKWLDSIIPIEVNADKSVAITVKITVKGDVDVKDIINKKELFNGLGEEYIDYSSIKYDGNSLILSIKKDALEKFNMDVKVKDAVEKSPNKGADWLKAFGVAALSQFATQAIIALLTAKPNTENPILHTQFDYTNVEDYKKHLLDNNPYLSDKEKKYIYDLAKQFKKDDGSWDAEAFKKVLDVSFAGTQSFLSQLELERGLRKQRSAQVKVNSDEQNNDTPTTQPLAQGETDCNVDAQKESLTYQRQFGDRWYLLVNAFYEDLCKEYGVTKAVKIVQKELSVDQNGNFDKQKFWELTSKDSPTAGDLPKTIEFPGVIVVDNKEYFINRNPEIKRETQNNASNKKPRKAKGNTGRRPVKKGTPNNNNVGQEQFKATDCNDNTAHAYGSAENAKNKLKYKQNEE